MKLDIFPNEYMIIIDNNIVGSISARNLLYLGNQWESCPFIKQYTGVELWIGPIDNVQQQIVDNINEKHINDEDFKKIKFKKGKIVKDANRMKVSRIMTILKRICPTLIILLSVSSIPANAGVDEACGVAKQGASLFPDSTHNIERLLKETNCLLRYMIKQGETKHDG